MSAPHAVSDTSLAQFTLKWTRNCPYALSTRGKTAREPSGPLLHSDLCSATSNISKESSQNWSAFPLHSPINPVPSNQTSVGSRNCISGVWFFSSFRNFCCEMQKVADTTVFQRIFPQERYHVWCSRLDILTLHPTLRWQLDFNKEWGLWFGKYGIFLTALGHI